MTHLREQVRAWLIEEKIGLIDKAELVRRADEAIQELDKPPDYLIRVSLGEDLGYVPRLDLVKEGVTSADSPRTAQAILQRYKDGVISLDDVGLYALNMCSLLDTEDASYVDFDWINDEVHLVDQGIKDEARSEQTILEVLERLSVSSPGGQSRIC